MSDDATAVAEYGAETKAMGDKIAELTLKQAKELSDYLKDVHGIEPAAGGGVMMAAPAGGGDGAAAAVETDRIRCRSDRFWRQEAERCQGRQEPDRRFADGRQENGRKRTSHT